MSWEAIPYKAYVKREEGQRAKGRHRVRWRDNIKDILLQHQMKLEEATRNARSRTLHLHLLDAQSGKRGSEEEYCHLSHANTNAQDGFTRFNNKYRVKNILFNH